MSVSPVALVAVLSIAAPLYAQAPRAREVSATGGLAHIASEATPVSSPWGGASFAFRAGRGYIKFDYEHFRRHFTYEIAGLVLGDERQRFHLIGAGWLIESMPGRITAFFQVGGMFGIQTSSFDSRDAVQRPGYDRTPDLFGPALAGGVTVVLASGLFVRPELRWKFLGPGPIVPFQPGLTAGWRF